MGSQYKHSMQAILDALDPSSSFSDGRAAKIKKTELYKDVAGRLSALAHPRRFRPWTWRYIQSVAQGSVQPSKDLLQAMNRLGALLDGAPAILEDAHPITIYGDPQRIKSGSLVLGKSRQCANPACLVWFVPVVPNQIYHDPKCRRRFNGR